MAGVRGRSGRPKEIGRLYRFSYRFRPGEDPPELEALLEAISAAKGAKRRDILRSALLGGAQQAQQTADRSEDSEIADMLDEMFGTF